MAIVSNQLKVARDWIKSHTPPRSFFHRSDLIFPPFFLHFFLVYSTRMLKRNGPGSDWSRRWWKTGEAGDTFLMMGFYASPPCCYSPRCACLSLRFLQAAVYVVPSCPAIYEYSSSTPTFRSTTLTLSWLWRLFFLFVRVFFFFFPWMFNEARTVRDRSSSRLFFHLIFKSMAAVHKTVGTLLVFST